MSLILKIIVFIFIEFAVYTCHASSRIRKIFLESYDIDILSSMPENKDRFLGTAGRDNLLCFKNEVSHSPAYIETIGCMIHLPYMNCESLWGSKQIILDVNGSVEFYRVNNLPLEEVSSINATRWLQVVDNKREVKHIAAEPVYICSRSISFGATISSFEVNFRPVFIREKDRFQTLTKIGVHCGLIAAVSSIWLLPYLISFATASFVYTHGIKYLLLILFFCCNIALLTPLMLTKKNRHIARLYLKYFFTRVQVNLPLLVILVTYLPTTIISNKIFFCLG